MANSVSDEQAEIKSSLHGRTAELVKGEKKRKNCLFFHEVGRLFIVGLSEKTCLLCRADERR